MWLAGCGSAEDAEPVVADAPEVETVAEAAPDATAPVFGTPSAAKETTVDSEPDPYGLRAAREGMESTSELEACAGDTDCPEHAEARFFRDMMEIRTGDWAEPDPRANEKLTALMERQQAIMAEVDLDLTELAGEPESYMAAMDCLRDAGSCEGTALEERSARGDFDAYREVAGEVEREMLAMNEVTNAEVQAMMSDFLAMAQETAALGSPSANATLGMFYSQPELSAGMLSGLIERNDALAVDHLIAAADKGSPEGAFSLAQMIHVGRAGPTHDVDKLLRKAYKGNVPEAGHILLQRQRDRGAVDPELEAELGAGNFNTAYATYSWDVHPDKPETVEAREAALRKFWEAESEAMSDHYVLDEDHDLLLTPAEVME